MNRSCDAWKNDGRSNVSSGSGGRLAPTSSRRTVSRWRIRAAVGLTSWVLVLSAAVPAASQHATLGPGDVLVMNSASLLEIDPTTGASHTLSDFRDASQGPTLPLQPPRPFFGGVVVESPATVLVAHSHFGSKGAVLRVEVSTGSRTILTDFGDPTQGPLAHPAGVTGQLTILPSGDLLAIDMEILFRVDRVSGMRTIVSDFGDPRGGPLIDFLTGLASDEFGQVFVGDVQGAGQSGQGAVLRVDTTTGIRIIVSDFGDAAQGPTGAAGFLAVDLGGRIVVSDGQGDRLVRVDPLTGARTLLSDFDNPLQGRTSQPRGLAVEDSGDIVVAGGSLVHRVDGATGLRTVLAEVTSNLVAVVPAAIVNDLVELSGLTTSFDPTPRPSAPAGTFTVTATFALAGPDPIRGPFFRVAELSGGNALVNADGGPGGVRSRLTPNIGAAGLWLPGALVTADFVIGLQTRQPFTFLVNVLGGID